MRRRWIVGLVVVALGVGGVGYRVTRPTRVTAGRVERGSAIDAVYASGTVEAVDRVELKARVAGPVVELTVREGDTVRAGQVVARIDAPVLRYDVQRGQVDLSSARVRASRAPQVAALEAQAMGAEAQLAQAVEDRDRVERLVRSGAASAQELARARTQVRALEGQLAALRAQARDVRLVLAADAARQAAGVATLQARAADAEVRSPMDGVVLARHVEQGESVGVNQDLLRVGDVRRLHIESAVDESDVGRVRVGMAAAVRLYAFEGVVFTARVTAIQPEADRERKTFQVDVALDRPPEGLRPGMTAEVNVLTARHEGAVLAPADGVRDGVAWVVGRDGRLARRAVTVGIRDLAAVEALRGLSPGELVVTGDTDALREGQRVQATMVSADAGRGP